MSTLLHEYDLSQYTVYILDRIIDRFSIDESFNIYELVKESVSYKCILPSQNELVMETYNNIKEHLVKNGFVIERKEMTSYILTAKGIELKTCGTLEKYEKMETKKQKRSFLHSLFFKNRSKTLPVNKVLVEYYE